MTSPNLPARGFRRAAGALLALALLAPLAPASAGPEETRRELERAKERVEALKDELDATEARLEDAHAKLLSLTAQVSQATTYVEGLRTAIYEAGREIKRSEREAERLQDNLDQRARSAYIQGPAGAVELILEADSLADLADRFTYLDILNRNDADLAAGVAVERQQVLDLQSNLRVYRIQEQRRLDRLKVQQARQQALFEQVAALKADFDDKLDEARETAEVLGKKLQRQLAAQYATTSVGSSGPPVSADGPLYWCPVDQPRSYVDDFGAPRVGHTHQGNDIFAPEGTPIRAPFEGTAEEGYDGLGGIVVHVYGSANADYVYNAHLSRHAGVDGDHVQPGALIGYVGNTGNAQGTSPHDHFEYHPGGGSAVSPYVYLNEVCGVGGAG